MDIPIQALHHQIVMLRCWRANTDCIHIFQQRTHIPKIRDFIRSSYISTTLGIHIADPYKLYILQIGINTTVILSHPASTNHTNSDLFHNSSISTYEMQNHFTIIYSLESAISLLEQYQLQFEHAYSQIHHW